MAARELSAIRVRVKLIAKPEGQQWSASLRGEHSLPRCVSRSRGKIILTLTGAGHEYYMKKKHIAKVVQEEVSGYST